MATTNQVNDAKKRMEQAEAAMRQYADRDDSQPVDIKLHVRLSDELEEAKDEYLRLLAELNQG